jgi:glycosyltransferase involved in cell wall biosynthesis
MKVIYCRPFNVANNNYIEIHKEIWKSLGFKVKSIRTINFKTLFYRKNNIAVINWLEDSIVDSNNGRVSFFLFTRRFFLLMLLRIMCGKLIWVQHNYVPHSLKGDDTLPYFKAFCKLIYLVSDVKVSHAPTDNEFKGVVIDHPLYPKAVNQDNITLNNDFLIIGAVTEYKQIDKLLLDWPSEFKLHIAGKCDSSILEKNIKEVISSRKLNVTWDKRFLSHEEVELYLRSSKVVIIPHKEDSMIVSGAFYHGISNGCSILMRDSSFYKYVSTWFKHVDSFNSENIKNKCQLSLNDYNQKEVLLSAHKHCSDSKLAKMWNEIL